MLAFLRVVALVPAFLIINLIVLGVCIARPFHRNNVNMAGRAYAWMAPIVGLKVRIRRDSAVTLNQPYVYIANHQNSFDIITIAKAAMPGVVTIGKKSLKWIPIFGQIYWLSGNIMIDRKNSGKARDTLMAAAKKVRRKRTSVWFFPEGTRSYGRGLLPFKQGAFRLAKATGEPVVIVAASNLHNKVKWNRWNNGEVLIDLLPPIPLTDERSIKEWMLLCHERMAEHIEKLDAEVAEREKSR